MRVKVRCMNFDCRAIISADESKMGSTARCPKCHEKFILKPMAETMAAEEDTHGDAQESPLGKEPAKATSGKKAIGRFQLKKRLGAGGFGTVYLAHDPVLGRDVALKVPNPAVLESPKAKERFLREPKAAAQLQHPHIVAIYDTGVDGKYHYIASAFIEGETLQQIVEREKPKPRQAAEWARDLAGALQYAHEHGIVHRDVKPHNVMVDSLGTPMLMDFGLAHLQDSEDKLTKDGAVMGTPAYMAPEQADSKFGEVGPLSDQYALGTVLYQLLTGDTPFSGPPSVVLFNVLNLEPKPARAIEKKVPKDLETICLKAMTKEPGGRYTDCAALAADLDRYLDGLPIEARPISSAERFVRWCKRRPALAGTIAVAAALLVTVGVVTSVYFGTSEQLGRETAHRAAAEQSAVEKSKELDATKGKLSEAEARLQAAREELNAARAELDAAKDALALAQTEAEREAARNRLAEAEARLAHAQQELDAATGEAESSSVTGDQQFAASRDLSVDAAESTDPSVANNVALVGLVEGPSQLVGKTRWQLETRFPRCYVCSITWSPNKQTIALGMQTGTIRLYDADSMELVGVLAGHTDEASQLRWSPDGRRLASASFDDTVRIWTADGTPAALLTNHTGNVCSLAWSPDGKTLASGSWDKSVRLWDTEGNEVGLLEGHGSGADSLAWSPDGKTIASGSADHSIRFWDADGTPRKVIRGHEHTVRSLAWSPNGQHLAAAGGEEKTIRVYSAEGEEERVIRGHSGDVRSVAWSPDGRWIASTDGRSAVGLWRADGKPGTMLNQKVRWNGFQDAVWSPDGRSLAAAVGSGYCVWQLDQLDKPTIFQPNLVYSVSLDWHPQGEWIVVGTQYAADNHLFICLSDGTIGAIPDAAMGGVTSVAWSPNGQYLAYSGWSDTAWIIRADGSVERELAGHKERIPGIAWSPDGTLLATDSVDGTVRVWTAATGASRVLPGPRGGNGRVSWSADGRFLAACSEEDQIYVWQTRGGPPRILRGHDSTVTGVAWSPSGSWLASVGRDNKARLWKSDGSVGPVLESHSGLETVAWRRDGGQLAVGNGNGEIEVWLPEGKPVRSWTAHDSSVKVISWSPEGKRLASMGWTDGTLKVWDAANGDLLWRRLFFRSGTTAAVTPGGKFLQTDRSVIESEFVYLVEQPSGKVDVLRPSQFARLVVGRR